MSAQWNWRVQRLAAGWRFGLLAGSDFFVLWLGRRGVVVSSKPYFN